MKINKSLNEKLNKQINEAVSLTEDETKPIAVDVIGDGTEAVPADKESALKIKNALTDVLDDALADALDALEDGNYKANCNVLVKGLPGSGKTANIMNWCKANGCNCYYLDAKNPDIQLLTSGASSIDRTDPKHPKVQQAYSDALAPLNQPRTILFLDELNRQIKEYLRGSLLTLIADRRVAGDGPDGFTYFPNLLFTVACINPPAGKKDLGATKLNDAEKRRFYYYCLFDSNKASTTEYLTKYYDDVLIRAAADKANPRFNLRVDRAVLSQWLGNKIVNHPKFRYSEMADLEVSSETDTKIMCQSLLTELIDHCHGDINRLKKDINRTNLIAEAKEMLLTILDTITLPDVNLLRAKKARELGIDLGVAPAPAEETKPETPAEETSVGTGRTKWDFSGDDDDKDFETSAGVTDDRVAAGAKDAVAVAKSISAFMDTCLD